MTGWLARCAGAALCLLMAACSSAHYAINPPLVQVDPQQGYRLQRFVAQDPEDSLLLHVSFSGGGLRAATLGLGVLDELRDTTIDWDGRHERLFDQIDIVMGLSGGSMLVGALAMGGEAGLARFEEALLHGSPQSDFARGLLAPATLWRLSSPSFGRSDAFERFLDERLFHGTTFADLSDQPRKPFAVIYASDMVNGGRFEFVQEQFDFLCSDLGGVKLARAVAASSAVPLLLSPVTFWNHVTATPGQDCGPPLLRRAAAAQPAAVNSRRMSELESYRDLQAGGPRRPFIHLVDGGLADNVSVRGPTDYISQFGGIVGSARFAGYRHLRRVVFIVVNAETSARAPEDLSPQVPGPLRTALALADIPINRNSDAALGQMRTTFQVWRDEVRRAQARGEDTPFAPDVEFHLIEVTLDGPDAALAERLKAIPTTLELPASDITVLRKHARQRLRSAPEFRAMLRSLQGPTPHQ
ncbi:MAG: patatin-like phospholipase family protein [Burkholderiales bacterium]|nr:patatin-like phospholipase family protein [Burkholderiales bacterium]